MRTITSVTVCLALALLLTPQLRADAGAALSRAGFVTAAADYTEAGGRMLTKAVSALVENIMPTNSEHPATRR